MQRPMQRQGQGGPRGERREERSESGMIDKVVHINRVTKVVKGGKNFSFSALVVVGDGKGKVGFGSGKAKEVPAAIKKGIEIAKKNMIAISMSGTTIPHAALGHYGAGKVLLKPAQRRHRRHCRWSGPRHPRIRRHPEHPDQVPRHGQPAQRRQGHLRSPQTASQRG